MGLREVISWPGVVTKPYGYLWDQARALARRYRPTGFVGHSLGADYALRLSQSYRGSYKGYGRPAFSVRPGDIMNIGDPVSVFAIGRKRLAWGHGIASYQ